MLCRSQESGDKIIHVCACICNRNARKKRLVWRRKAGLSWPGLRVEGVLEGLVDAGWAGVALGATSCCQSGQFHVCELHLFKKDTGFKRKKKMTLTWGWGRTLYHAVVVALDCHFAGLPGWRRPRVSSLLPRLMAHPGSWLSPTGGGSS